MTKYDKLDYLVNQGKTMSIEMVINKQFQEKKLESLNQDRIFRENRDNALLNFGMNLFENGYQLEDFKLQMEYWSLYSQASEEEFTRINSLWLRYMEEMFKNVENIPTYEKVLEIFENPALFNNIENGYQIARRRSLAKENIQNSGKSR